MSLEGTRRRPSAARSIAIDRDTNTASIALLEYPEPKQQTQKNQHHVQWKTWRKYTSPLLVFLIAIFLTTSIWISLTSTLEWKKSPWGWFLKESSSEFDGVESSGKIGIDLHPEEHVFRPPRTNTYFWEVTSDVRYPDGVSKRVYLIDGWSFVSISSLSGVVFAFGWKYPPRPPKPPLRSPIFLTLTFLRYFSATTYQTPGSSLCSNS